MKINALIIFVFIWLLFSLTAYGQQYGILNPPQFNKDKHIYLIPQFNPDYINHDAILEIQQEASKLHFPFYVVLVQKLPGSDDPDKLAIKAIDGLAQDWAQTYPDFDVSKSQIFLLSYDPRKYAFLAGSKFKTDLGFERDAHKPYTDIFKKYATGTPKDPKTGIIKMMQAVDEHLFDQTDPQKIAMREEQARRTAVETRHKVAMEALNKQISKLNKLLQADARYLPQDISLYKAMLANAQNIRQQDNTEKMLEMAVAMKFDVNALQEHYDEKHNAAITATLLYIGKWLFILLTFGGTLFFTIRRYQTFRKLQEEFNEAYEQWNGKIVNASSKYVEFYGKKDDILSFISPQDHNPIGKSKEVYDRVIEEIDSIYAYVMAMQRHLDARKLEAGSASYFNLYPLKRALDSLIKEFEVDTGELDNSLFGGKTKKIKVQPKSIIGQLNERFSMSMEDWQKLQQTANIVLIPASEKLTPEKLDKLFALLDKNKISRHWVRTHPLVGGDDSDQTYYEQLDILRMTDPVAYYYEVQSVELLESEIEKNIQRLVNASDKANSAKTQSPRINPEIKLDPNDDPEITYNRAVQEYNRLTTFLSTKDDVTQVESQSTKTIELFEKCKEQQELIKNAIQSAEQNITEAERKMTIADQKLELAIKRIGEVEKIHSNVNAEPHIKDGKAYQSGGLKSFQKAERQYDEGRYLNAMRSAEEASDNYERAEKQFARAIAHCDELDEQKINYERKVKEMEEAREKHEKKLKKYKSDGSLSDYHPDNHVGPRDYSSLIVVLDQTTNDWQDQVKQAENDYEASRPKPTYSSSSNDSWSSRDDSSSSSSSWGGSDTSSSSSGDW